MNELIIYIDHLRSLKNISQDQFVEGVISLRQYHRYIAGKSSFPYSLFEPLSKKLNISFDIILENFQMDKKLENKLIIEYYHATLNHNLDLAETIKRKINTSNFYSNPSLLLYNHTEDLCLFERNQISDIEMLSRTLSLIDYPNVLNVALLNIYEFLILSSLLTANTFKDKTTLYHKLVSIINDDTMVLTNKHHSVYLLSLYRLSRYSSSIENYEDSIKFAKMIVAYNKEIHSFLYLDHAYLLIAVGYHRLNKISLFHKSLINLYHVIKTIDSPSLIESYKKKIYNIFKIDYKSFVLEYIKKANTN